MALEPAQSVAGADRFFIIGAQRSGTTSLWHWLDAHPQVCMAQPMRPEPKHFLGTDSAQAAQLEHYETTFFPAPSPAMLYGEKSTSYLEYSDVAHRIRSAYPQARIIVSLREPVERAVSNYWFSVSNGFEQRALDIALRELPAEADDSTALSTSPFDYRRRSRYQELLTPWIHEFGEQLTVVILEEAVENGWSHVADFLGLEISPAQPSSRQNEAPRSSQISPDLEAELVAEFSATAIWVQNYLGREIPAWNRSSTSNQPIKDI